MSADGFVQTSFNAWHSVIYHSFAGLQNGSPCPATKVVVRRSQSDVNTGMLQWYNFSNNMLDYDMKWLNWHSMLVIFTHEDNNGVVYGTSH